MSSFRMLSFKENGVTVDLLSLDDAFDAVEEGRIVKDTPVTVYFSDGRKVLGDAGDSEYLSPKFRPAVPEPAQALPEAAPVVVEPELAPDPVAVKPEPEPEPEPAQTEVREPAEVQEPVASTEPPPFVPPPSGSDTGSGSGKFWGGIIVAGALAYGAYAMFNQKQPDAVATDTIGASDAALAAAEAAAAAAMGNDDPSTWQTLHAVSPLNLRDEPGTKGGGGVVAKLPRGSELAGVIVPGKYDSTTSWFLIKKGPNTGRYASVVNLSETAPPDIDASSAGDYYLTATVTPVVSADSGAVSVAGNDQQYGEGEKVAVNGTVNGDWAEVRLKQGGAGYINWSNLTLNKPSATPFGADAADASSSSRALLLNNTCSDTVDLGIYYRQNGTWQANGGTTWRYNAGNRSFPTLGQDRRLYADSSTVYIIVFGRNGNRFPSGDGGNFNITYGNNRVTGYKIQASEAAGNAYQVNLCG